VPEGTALADNEVESITLSYTARLNKHVSQNLIFRVTANDIKIGGSAEYADIVNVAITNDNTINNTDVMVQAVVTLTEPDNEEIYNNIINKAVAINFVFTASVP
jgi:hypothetical protein